MTAEPAFPPPTTPRHAAPTVLQRRRGRPAIVVAIAATVASVSLAALAVSGDDDTITFEVTDASSDAPPDTVAPLPTDTTAASSSGTAATESSRIDTPRPAVDARDRTGEGADADDVAVDTEPVLSPLAALLGPRYSTIPVEIEPRPRPVALASDRIDVDDFPVRSVGLELDGQLEVPDETEIGWYQYGATAGRPGATVLAAHVSWNNTTGPFFRLGTKEPGDRLMVTLDDGTEREYEVTERTMYDKDELPRERIWRNTGPETLVLITCGGDFNPEIRRYRQNIVVYAVPVG